MFAGKRPTAAGSAVRQIRSGVFQVVRSTETPKSNDYFRPYRPAQSASEMWAAEDNRRVMADDKEQNR